LKALARSLREGRHTARFAAAAAPREVREALEKSGCWTRAEGPWREAAGANFWSTRLLDLVELVELERMNDPASSRSRNPVESPTRENATHE
jgi:hypothetical protein